MEKTIFAIEGTVENWEQALKLTFTKLYQQGCVKESFYDGCIQREKIFPTGLETEIPIAIPHTDSKHVCSPAICVLRLQKPVMFSLMEDDTKQAAVKFVFNMALNSGEEQLGMLTRIVETVQDTELLYQMKDMEIEQLEMMLQSKWCN